jgi:O-antigen/teichoic acid export membrane protein
LLIALILVGIAFFAPSLIMKGVTVGNQQKYFIFIIIIAAQTFITFTGSLFDCFLEGLQEYKLRNNTMIFITIAGSLVIYPLLKGGGGLITMAVASAVSSAIKFIFYGIVLATKKYGNFIFRPADTSYTTLKKMFSFGLKSLIYSISLQISTVTDSLIIGTFLGPSVVTLYIIPYNFITQARSFIWAMSRNFMPLFSELAALEHGEAAQILYFKASRIMVGIIVPLVIGIVMLGPSFLEHWMGLEYARSGKIVLYIIAAAYGVQWLNPLANRLLTGYEQHGIMARLGIIGSLVNLGLSLVLVQFIGKEGVALGTLLPVLIFEPIYLSKVCKVLKTSCWGYAAKVPVPLLAPAGVIVATIAGCCWLHPPASIVQVLLIASIGVSLYLPTFFMFSLSRNEQCMVLEKIGLLSADKE